LAVSWRRTAGGRGIIFKLRKNVRFSDGTPFTAADVAYTMQTLLDPNLHVPTADPFKTSQGSLQIVNPSPDEVSFLFPEPIAGLERLFDQVGIISKQSPKKEMATLGPFFVAEYKSGSEV